MKSSLFSFSFVAPLAAVCGVVPSSVVAQELPVAPVKPKLENADEVVKNSSKNAKADAESARSTSLRVLQQRAKDLNARMAQYQKDVASGKVTPFLEITKNWEQIKDSLVTLKKNVAALNTIPPANKQSYQKAQGQMLNALQPLGRFLQVADYQKVNTQLTKNQIVALDVLEQKWLAAPNTADRKNGFIEPLGSDHVYTLTHLPVPLSVKTAPGEKVMFRSDSGGHFENGLSIIEVVADKKTGVATVQWVTNGDSVADCPIEYSSATVAAPEGGSKITVVKLMLAPPPNVELPIPAKETLKK